MVVVFFENMILYKKIIQFKVGDKKLIKTIFMPEQESKISQEPSSEGTNNNMMAVLSYLGVLCLVPLIAVKNNEFVQYHAKQGLTLFIAEIATMLVSWIPFIGWLVGFVAWILWVILSIVGIMNVVNKKKKPLPVIGGFAKSLFKS